jgi:hypothetical protein
LKPAVVPAEVAVTGTFAMEPDEGVNWKAGVDPKLAAVTVWFGVEPATPLTVTVWVLSAKAATGRSSRKTAKGSLRTNRENTEEQEIPEFTHRPAPPSGEPASARAESVVNIKKEYARMKGIVLTILAESGEKLHFSRFI